MEMTSKDYNYLRLQFENSVHKRRGAEFQKLFEGIMERAFPDFERVRPYGDEGDGGNDGFRPSVGIYYQVYAPRDPSEKERSAADKLKKDFAKLKREWDRVASVREFVFVFNDRWEGATKHVHSALAELKAENPSTNFVLFLAKDLEGVFIELPEKHILALGFDVDATKAISVARQCLENVEIDLDHERGADAQRGLERLRAIVASLADRGLSLDFDILQARAAVKLEKVAEAKVQFEALRRRHPSEPRASLHLAEIEINLGNFDRNAELLAAAEGLDARNPLLTLQKRIRHLRLNLPTAAGDAAEDGFPREPRMRASFYRIHSSFLAQAGDHQEAMRYIDESIRLNPDKFSAYDAKISRLQDAAFDRGEGQERLEADMNAALDEISRSEEIFRSWGELNARSRALINYRKCLAYHALEDRASLERLAKEGLDLLLECHFDHTVEALLIAWLRFFEVPRKELDLLLLHTASSEKGVSDELAKMMLIKLMSHGILLTEGRAYFEKVGSRHALELVEAIERGDAEGVAALAKGDATFSVVLFNAGKNHPELRRRILEGLPEGVGFDKRKLKLLLAYDEGKFDEAFELLRELGISAFQPFEFDMILKAARAKEAWDFVAEILTRMLEHEGDAHIALQLKLDIVSANARLDRFAEMAVMGESILASEEERGLLGDANEEILLGQTTQARLMRGEYLEAKALLASRAPLPRSYEFKVGVEAVVCLKNNDGRGALAALVEGIRQAGNPTPVQYGGLFLTFVQLESLPELSADGDESVGPERFVKLQGQEQWYFVGKGDALDATKALPDDPRGSELLGKKVGDEVALGSRYRSGSRTQTVERVLPIEKYVHWKCVHHSQQLSEEGRWDAMEAIEVPTVDGTLDLTHLMARLEDERRPRDGFLEMYRRDAVPLALLAVSEGGLAHALGTVARDQHAFVRFSTGEGGDLDRQKAVARRLIAGEPFYLDGTSALALSRTGLLPAVHAHMPGLRVPQSVITFLLETRETFSGSPGPAGRMALVGGKLLLAEVDADAEARIEGDLREGIRLLESRPGAVIAISAAVKSSCLSEQKVPGSLSDACILAQRDATPVMTEDYLYLQGNALETKKRAPEHCSSFAFARALYEEGKLPFDRYLAFFAHLAACRFRFLPVTTEDIEKAVFGDGGIVAVRPERIRMLHFPLTLSSAYGVPLGMAFSVVGRFMVKVLMDDTVPVEAAERIFAEILAAFPVEDADRGRLKSLFLRMAAEVAMRQRARLLAPNTRTSEKLAALHRLVDMFVGRKVLEILPPVLLKPSSDE